MNNPYKVLGLNETATDAEIEEKYQALKAEYGEKRFLPGAEGNEAAKILTSVESAYRDIRALRASGEKVESDTTDFSGVEAALKAGNLSEAQTKLDAVGDRNAEWHYLQSFIYYKKNWMNESKKQLEISVSMDPNNEKYKKALADLNQRMQMDQQRVFSSGNAAGNSPYGQNDQGQMGGDSLSSCCATYLCCQMLNCFCR